MVNFMLCKSHLNQKKKMEMLNDPHQKRLSSKARGQKKTIVKQMQSTNKTRRYKNENFTLETMTYMNILSSKKEA